MGECVKIRRATIEPDGAELLADIIVGTAVTSVDITGLNIGKDDELLLVASTTNPTASYNDISLYINSNTTATNYYRQMLRGESTTVSVARSNSSIFSGNNPSWGSISIVNLKLTNSGYFVFQSHFTRDIGVANEIEIFELYGTTTFIISSLTSIRLQGNITNAIGIGSRFQLYKIGGA